MNDNFTNNDNTAVHNTTVEEKNNNLTDEKKTLNDIKELLEKNKISADDIKKFTEFQAVKSKKEDIENLLKKLKMTLLKIRLLLKVLMKY